MRFFNKKTSQINIAKSPKSGFSFIELIVYLAIISVFLAATVKVAWDMIYGRVKSQVLVEVNQNLRLVSKRISYEIRNASAINSVSGSSLSLANSDAARNPTEITLSAGQIMLGQGAAGACPTTNPCPITSNLVSVTSLDFIDLSNPNSSDIKFTITMEHTNPSGKQQWDKSQTYSSSAKLRSN